MLPFGLLVPALIALAPAQDVQRHSVVYFDADSTTLTPEAAANLDYVVATLLANPRLKVKLTGHTDRVGDADEAQYRSERMVIAVSRYLLEHGVEPDREIFESHGATRPAVPTKPGVPEPMNRRVEIDMVDG